MKPMSDIERRLHAYMVALEAIDRKYRTKETTARMNNFSDGVGERRAQIIQWINWVEANVMNIQWCQELVSTAVALRLGGKQ